MLFILEIIFVIVAWNRGWKSMALIPLACVFIIGLFIGLSGATPEAYASAMFFDIIASIVLIWMSVVGKK